MDLKNKQKVENFLKYFARPRFCAQSDQAIYYHLHPFSKRITPEKLGLHYLP